MANEIVKEDLPKVAKLLETVMNVKGYDTIERMGGLTNHTYKVTLKDGQIYAVRIPGEGTEGMIVRSDELVSTELACALSIDTELLYFGQDGSKVTRYIKNAITMSAKTLKEGLRIKQIAEVLKKLHNSGKDTKVPFEVFDMASTYEKVIRNNNVPMFEDYSKIKAEVMGIKEMIDTTHSIKKVPCHNDALCENWIAGNDRMYLIDWEYAGMNDGMWDLADVSIEANYDKETDEILLREYLGRQPKRSDWEHFLASKIYVDYLWTLWAKTRVPFDGEPMELWAGERYTRLKSNIDKFKNIREEV